MCEEKRTNEDGKFIKIIVKRSNETEKNPDFHLQSRVRSACMCVRVCVCAIQIEFFPLSAILKKRAYSAVIEFVLHGLLCSLFVEAKRANNQPSCQLATLKAAFFPRRNVIMNTPISPPLTRFEMPTAANEHKKWPVHAVRLHLLQLTTRRRDWRWSDHLCIAIDFIACPRVNQ